MVRTQSARPPHLDPPATSRQAIQGFQLTDRHKAARALQQRSAPGGRAAYRDGPQSESQLPLSSAMTIALLVALAGSLGLMAFIVKRLEQS